MIYFKYHIIKRILLDILFSAEETLCLPHSLIVLNPWKTFSQLNLIAKWECCKHSGYESLWIIIASCLVSRINILPLPVISLTFSANSLQLLSAMILNPLTIFNITSMHLIGLFYDNWKFQDEHQRFLEQVALVEKKALSLQAPQNPSDSDNEDGGEHLGPDDRLALEYVIANSLNSLKKTLCEVVDSWNNRWKWL